jgi:pilus assembly protein Flp/PilA
VARVIPSVVCMAIIAAYARFASLEERDRGATATEYGLLVALIAFAIVVGVVFFGQNLNNWFDRMGHTVQSYSS